MSKQRNVVEECEALAEEVEACAGWAILTTFDETPGMMVPNGSRAYMVSVNHPDGGLMYVHGIRALYHPERALEWRLSGMTMIAVPYRDVIAWFEKGEEQ